MNRTQFHTEHRPHQIDPSVFIAPGAVIVGDVTIAEGCSIWFHAVLRADTDPIVIGVGTNIQEGALFHADPGYPVSVGAGVTIGHGAVVHGATIGNNCMIGIRAVLLNGANIGENSLVGADSLVTQGRTFPSGSLILGSPARLARALTDEEIERNRQASETYRLRGRAFRKAYAAPNADTML